MRFPRDAFSPAFALPYTALAVVLTAMSLANTAHAQSEHELVFFLGTQSVNSFNIEGDNIKGARVIATSDILYSFSNGRFRLLGEYLWSTDESEIERLKIGWHLDESTMLSFGRLHQPSKYWTTEYHHGQYLQTSISRPGLEEWEDEGGPIGSHVFGAMLESGFQRRDGSGIQYAVSLGLAPRYEEDSLHPFDILDPESGHGAGLTGRAAWRPDHFGDDQFGVLGGYNDIEVEETSRAGLDGITNIEQFTVGVFADVRHDRWRLIGSAVFFENRIETTGGKVTDNFTSGYLQLEYVWRPDFTLFGRGEFSGSEDDSLYLRYLPDFIAHRTMAGVRWDFADRHSLSLELSSAQRQGDDFLHEDFDQLRVQWSAALP